MVGNIYEIMLQVWDNLWFVGAPKSNHFFLQKRYLTFSSTCNWGFGYEVFKCREKLENYAESETWPWQCDVKRYLGNDYPEVGS